MSKGETKLATKIIHCSCSNAYQDAEYGIGKRVHNEAPKANGYRCTVCSNVKKS